MVDVRSNRGALRAPSAVAVALVLWTGCGGVNVVRKQKLELKPASLPLRTFSYPSGLRVIVEKDTRTPLAGVFVVVGSGSSSDPAGKEGLAHYVEHLAFQSRPFGEGSFSDLIDNAGAIQRNAFTNFDSTTYYEIGPAAALPKLLRAEAVRMVIPVSDIPDATRAVELDVVHNELRERGETGVVGDVYARLQAALFPAGHLYARPIGGSHESIGAITKDDVDAFAKAHYRPDNMTLVLLGNIELETADRLLAESLPRGLVEAPQPVRLPERLAATPPPVPAPAAQSGLPRAEAAIASPELWVGWALPRGFDRDGYLLSFLASAARQRLSRLRIDDADIARIDVQPVPGKEASMLLCRVSLHEGAAPEKTLDRVLGEAPKIVNGFLNDPNDHAFTAGRSQYSFGEMAYSRARRSILVSELLQMQDLVGRGLRRATVTHFSQDPTLLSRAMHDLGELKPERFRDYAQPYLTSDRARAVLFLPKDGGTGAASAAVVDRAPLDRARKTERLEPPPAEWSDALLTTPGQLTAYRLKNGLSVVLERRPGLPLLTATLSVGIPAASAKEAGAYAFAEAMSRPLSQFNDPSEYGGLAAGSYDADQIVERVEASSGNAEGIVATLAERARTMGVERQDGVQYKDQILPSYRRLERDPHRAAQRDFYQSLVPDAAHVRVPKLDELEAASAGDAKAWLDREWSPANATLAVVGDFDEAELKGYVDSSFGGWSGGPPPAAPKADAAAPKPRADVRTLTARRPGASQGEIHFGCRLPDVTSGPLAVRHELAALVLGNQLSEILRERLGATYGVGARAVELLGGTSYLELSANVENAKLTPALAELRKTLDRLSQAPASAQALRWARYRKASSVALNQMTNAAAAAFILQRAQFGLSPDLAEVRRELAAVSEQDVQADLQHCLASNPTLSIVGDEQATRAAIAEAWK